MSVGIKRWNLSSIVVRPSFRDKALVYSDRTKVGHVIRDVCRASHQDPRRFFGLLVGVFVLFLRVWQRQANNDFIPILPV